jgi:hypothetical protein
MFIMMVMMMSLPISQKGSGGKRKWFETKFGVTQSVWCLTTDWTTEVRYLAEAKDFSSSLCVQTSSEAHPASCTMGTGALSLE